MEKISTEVDFHLLTRLIKFSPGDPEENADTYKQINRTIARCVLQRSSAAGYFAFGMWGKQDVNKFKVSIPIIGKKDNRAVVFPNDIRQDIPISNMKGKYKAVALLLCGKALPESEIMGFDFEAVVIDEKRTR